MAVTGHRFAHFRHGWPLIMQTIGVDILWSLPIGLKLQIDDKAAEP